MSERHLTRLEHGESPLSHLQKLAFAGYYRVTPEEIEDVPLRRNAA